MDYNRLSVLRQTPDWVLWRAEHPVSGGRFAVKDVLPTAADRRRALERLREEYEFLNAFDHPNLLKPRQFDPAKGRVLYEDAQCTLEALAVQEGRLPVDLVANVLKQAADGLSALHGRKYGHGSLNTTTMLVSPSGAVKLGGVVGYQFKSTTPLPPPEQGTRYQAPEVLTKGVSACTPASDLYCLGFVALELLAGDEFEKLFGLKADRGESASVKWLAWHADPTKALPPLKEALPNALESLVRLIESLTVKQEPARGFRTADELVQTLAEYGLNSTRNLPPWRGDEARPSGGPPPLLKAGAAGKAGSLILREVTATSGHVFEAPRPVLVGRVSDCNLVIDSPEVDGKHALITRSADAWWVHDLVSKRGTFLNGTRVRQHPLRDGDELSFGGRAYRVGVVGDPKGEAPKPAPDTPAARPRRAGGGAFTIKTGRGTLTAGKKLHEGAGGTLYQAVLERNGKRRQAALRVFPPAFSFNETEIRRFLRGAPLAAQLGPRHFVQLYAGGSTRMGGGKRWFVAMEYMPGGSLRDALRNGPLAPRAVVRCGVEALQALKELEAAGLLHRNISPSCLLFDPRGTVKLGDFALLRSATPETFHLITQSGMMAGEQLYLAPELLDDKVEPTPACDVYGLGAALYEAVTGLPALRRGRDLPEQIEILLKEEVKPAHKAKPGVPAALSEVLAKALQKQPARRFQTAAEFEEALGLAAG